MSKLKLCRHRLAAALAAAFIVAGCAAPTVDDYAAEQPVLDLAQYLNGPLTAHGVFTDRSGRVVKRFKVAMTGTWNGNEGVLDEDFSYSDGSKQRRVWKLVKLQGGGNEGRYTGTADDVAGVALGHAAGNAFHWKYTLKLPVDGKVVEVQFDDWMWLVDDRVMLNKAVMSKYGITLGEVTLAFSKP